jgi:hypothetical protein
LTRREGAVNAIELTTELQGDLRAWIAAYEEAHIFMGERPNVTLSAIARDELR